VARFACPAVRSHALEEGTRQIDPTPIRAVRFRRTIWVREEYSVGNEILEIRELAVDRCDPNEQRACNQSCADRQALVSFDGPQFT
jgi:hypothetical protein